MDILSFCKNANDILSPFVGLLTAVNSFIIVVCFVKERFFTDDKFFIKVIKNGDITFYNKGKYPVVITEVAIWVEDKAEIATKIENLLENDLKIFGRDKKNFYISFNTNEFNEIRQKKYKAIYLCISIKSDSGSIYDQLVYVLSNKKGIFRFSKCKLNKDLSYIKQ